MKPFSVFVIPLAAIAVSFASSHATAPPMEPWRPTRDQVLDIRANFLSMRDSRGRVMLSWFYPSLNAADKADWRGRWKAARLTHVVLSPIMQYPGYWASGADWRWDPGRFAEAVREVIDAHFVPILFLSSGEGGTGWELGPTGLVAGYVRALKERGLLPYVWLVPGFEVVGPSGGWSSHELSTALLTIHGLAPGTPLGVHLQPERPAGASRPIEADDPWHGDELQFWTSHGGEYVDALLYQTQHGRELLAPDGARDPYACRGGVNPCGQWEGPWIEVLERLGVGGHGWRKVSLSFFEVTGSDYFRDRATDEDVVRLSNRARQLCNGWGVRCTYGNGLPR